MRSTLLSQLSLPFTAALATISVVSCGSDQKAATKGMNVVFIMTDDQGYPDVGFTGNPYIKTPNIDRLAEQSYRFTNYHTGTNSAPSRAGLMTGCYNNSVGVWHTVMGRELLSLDNTLIPEVFADNGYATAMFGKWHLGDNEPYRPCDRGFQRALWHRGGGVGQTPDHWGNDYFDDYYYLNDSLVKVDGYCTDVFFDGASEFIRRNVDKPFFCYISTNAPHAPRHVEERYVEPYRDNPEIVSPQFYGMIANIDENVGRLEALLKELKIDDNTIVIFTTDNGSAGGVRVNRETGEVLAGYYGNMRGRKGMVYEGGHRTPFTVKIPGHEAFACDIEQLVGIIDVAPTLYEMLSFNRQPENMDGISMAQLIDNTEKRVDRYLVVDTQREEFLDRENPSCVMREDWRLINNKELYNVSSDPSQSIDIAENHPEIVAELRGVFDNWWVEVSKSADRMNYIPLCCDRSKSVSLNSHDRHDPLNRKCPAEQRDIRAGFKPETSTYWAVEVVEDGEYNFDLYRWAKEADLPLSGSAPAGGAIPNGKRYEAGAIIDNIIGGEIIIGDIHSSVEVKIDSNTKCISLRGVKLRKGEYKLYANFLTKDGPIGAHYVDIKRE